MYIETVGRIFLVLWFVFFWVAMLNDPEEIIENIVGTFVLTFVILMILFFIASPFLAAFGLFG